MKLHVENLFVFGVFNFFLSSNLQILEKGDLQVSEKERVAQSDSSFKEIANLIANMCVNPDTKRPYSSGVIENALHEAHLSLKPNRSVKQQVKKLLKVLYF